MIENKINPYPGLRPFSNEESHLFFGREDEINIFGSEIISRRLSILHGKTGSGKTSFFEAGLGPNKLHPYSFTSFRILFKEDPFKSIKFGIFDNKSLKNGNMSATKFKEGKFFEDIYSKFETTEELRVVLFFDQFEDFFTIRIDEKLKKSFGYELASLVYDSKLPIKVVIGIRNDFLFELDSFRSEIPDIYKTTYYLHDLSRESAIRAIKQPALRYEIIFEDNLANKLIDDLTNENNQISPPPLQIICNKLVETSSNSKIKLNDYKNKLGGKEKILNSFIEEILDNKIVTSKRKAVINILEQLHFQGLTKYPRPLEFLEKKAKLEKENLKDVLNYLEKENLLTREVRENTIWYELKHDYLIGPIKEWTDKLINEYKKQQRLKYQLLIVLLTIALVITLIYSLSRPVSYKDVQKSLNKGQTSLKEGNLKDAINEFNKYINEFPTLDAYEGLISAYSKQDSLEETKESYETALELIRYDRFEHRRLAIEAYEFFKEKAQDNIARDFLLEHLKLFNGHINSLTNIQKDYVLKSYFKEIAEGQNNKKPEIINSALQYLRTTPSFKIDELEISNSFEFIRAILYQNKLAREDDSFNKLKRQFSVTEDPDIGDLIYFPKWPTIVGLYLGQEPLNNSIYYLGLNVSSPEVAFEELNEEQEVEYRKLP